MNIIVVSLVLSPVCGPYPELDTFSLAVVVSTKIIIAGARIKHTSREPNLGKVKEQVFLSIGRV